MNIVQSVVIKCHYFTCQRNLLIISSTLNILNNKLHVNFWHWIYSIGEIWVNNLSNDENGKIVFCKKISKKLMGNIQNLSHNVLKVNGSTFGIT